MKAVGKSCAAYLSALYCQAAVVIRVIFSTLCSALSLRAVTLVQRDT